MLLFKLLTYIPLYLGDYRNIINSFNLKNNNEYDQFMGMMGDYYKITGITNINFDLLTHLSKSNILFDQALLLKLFKVDISKYGSDIQNIILKYYNDLLL